MDHSRFLPKHMLKQIPGTPEYNDHKKKQQENFEFLKINQQAQRIIQVLHHELKDNPLFVEASREANKGLRNTSVLHLNGRDSFEDAVIAKRSLILIAKTVHLLQDKSMFVSHGHNAMRLKQSLTFHISHDNELEKSFHNLYIELRK